MCGSADIHIPTAKDISDCEDPCSKKNSLENPLEWIMLKEKEKCNYKIEKCSTSLKVKKD